jgi:L-2-hydroxyglutarate oxidase LhgO
MRAIYLLPLSLMLLAGCGDADTTNRTATTTDPLAEDADRYEVGKPVLDEPAVDTDPAETLPQSDLNSPSATIEDTPSSGAIENPTSGLGEGSALDEKSPFDQSENQPDLDTTANIRSQIVDADMSISARNIQIVTQNGRVTLSGEVENQEEMNRIEEIATSIAGQGNVDNNLKIDE